MNEEKSTKQTARNTTLGKLPDFLGGENLENKNITVFVGKGTMKTNSDFVIMFYQNVLSDILASKLTLTDVKVLLGVLNHVGRGNVVNLTQNQIASEVGLTQPQVSKSWKKLISSNIFLQNEHGSVFLNPLYIAKQSLRSVKKSEAYDLAKNTQKEKDMAF